MASNRSARAPAAEASSALRALGLSAGSILDQIHDAVIAIDEEHRVVYWGGGARELYGLDASEAVGHVLSDLHTYRWVDAAAERDAYARLERDGRWRGKNIHVLRSGEERYVDSTVTVLRDEDGRRVGLLAVIRDETARLRAEQELRDVEARAKLVLDSINEGFYLVDASWRLTYVNPHAAQILGFEIPAVLGRVLWEVFPALAGSAFEALYRRVATERRPGSVRALYPSRGRTYEARAYPSGDGIAVYFEDITERVRANAALEQSEREAHERAEELDAIMRAVPAAIWITRDRDCATIVGNPASYRIARTAEGTNVSATPGEAPLHRPFVEHVNGAPIAPEDLSLQVAARTGKPVVDTEFSLVFDDGDVVHLAGNAAPLFTATGEPRGAVAAFVDVTRMKQAAQASERAAKFAELFVAMLGHDLRNPLSAMMSGAHLLGLIVRDNERAQRVVERVRNSGERMARMIDQILDFSRIRSGHGLPYEPCEADMAALVARARDELVARGARIEVDATGDTSGSWDEDRVAQVLSNLLGNAVEHSPEGSTVRVRIEATSPSTLRVAIRNEGTIPAETIPSLFEPFRQGRLEARSSGLGLGLYITSEILRLHGGRIDVTSDDAGTTFAIELPRHAPSRRAP